MSKAHPSRDIALAESELPSQPESFNRWAIIVGISKYQTASLNLQYADRDAEKLYQLLLTPSGGHFKKDFICKLTNKTATTGNIIRALRAFLKKPAREDLVIIYFACHGAPDPERPENVYLLTHDTNPADIAGTALPVGDINRALKDTLLSEKVIILADTCHSAAIGGGMRSRGLDESTALINRYLQEISAARGGTALLTSAEAHEVSFEDEKWGGGHGVFTYYLLKGLNGEADVNNNGFITVGELFEYVRENVKKATNHKQHPSIGTNPFDRNLPLAIITSKTTNQTSAPQGLLTSSSLLLSSPKHRKHKTQLWTIGACLTVAFAGLSWVLLDGRIEPRLPEDRDDRGAVIDSENPDQTKNPILEDPLTTKINQTLTIASSFEKAAIDQMTIENITRENLDLASDNWQEGINVLNTLVSENSLPPSSKAGRKLSEYRNRLLYTEARKHGRAASNLIDRKVVIASEISRRVDITSKDCQKVEELWQSGIDKLREIPETDPNYASVDEKIAEYTDGLGYAGKKKILADYSRAIQIAEETAIWSQTAKTSDSWLKIADLWSQAAALMAEVPNEPMTHREVAKARIPIYKRNAIDALENAGSCSKKC